MDVGDGVELPHMDIGALHVLCREGEAPGRSDFVDQLHEASYLEALDLLADEEVARVKMELICGALGLREAYSLTKPEVAELYSRPRVTEYGQRKGLLTGVAFDLNTNDEDGNP